MSISSSIKLFAAFLNVVFLVACATPSQIYWDHKVKELCEKDGGVTVYEKVELTKEQYPNLFDSRGVLMIPSESHKKLSDPFYFSYKNEVLLNEKPRVWKDEMLIIRSSDNKVLGRQISYSRRGGDIPTGISHESSYGCSKIKSINLNLTKSVLLIKGD